MNARLWRIWVTGASLALATLPPVPSAALSSFPDLRQVQERGALRVGLVAKDIPPLLVTGSDGEPAGIEIAMAKGLARRLGVKLEFVRTAATHDELVAQVASGEVDVAVSSVTRTVERAQVVRFSRPYLTQSVAVALNRVRALQENVACPDTPADAAALAARPGDSASRAAAPMNRRCATRTKRSIRWSSTPKGNFRTLWKPTSSSPVWAARSGCASCSPGTQRLASSSSFA